jgi:peptide/nickel transport system ATP-binding protein
LLSAKLKSRFAGQTTLLSALLEIENLKMYYHLPEGIVRALDGINMKVMKGEVVGIIGESGCGKSSLALSILRMIPDPPGRIAGGKITYKGKNLLDLTEREMQSLRGKEISTVFQDPMTYLNPTMKIGDQIAEKIVLHEGIRKSEAKSEVVNLLKTVQMPSAETIVSRYPFQLSGGMLQRVLIAIALACSPSLIIADEPTTALDSTIQAQILEVLENLVNQFDASLILITHDMGVAAEVCDRIYVMYAGKVVEESSAGSLYESPQHPYTVALLESTLSIGRFKEEIHPIPGTVPNLIAPPNGCRFHPRCSKMMNICREQEPPPFLLSTDHTSYCWLLDREHDAGPN